MTDTVLTCPKCGQEIALSEALTAQLRGAIEASLRVQHEAHLKRVLNAAEARGHKEAAHVAALARESADKELKFIREQFAEQQRKAREAQRAELDLRKDKAALEQRARDIDLEIARRVDAAKQHLEEAVRKSAVDEQALKMREKDKQIEDLKKLAEELKRKSDQGSQTLQSAWLAKLRDDTRAAGGNISVLVSVVRFADHFRAKVHGIVEAFTALQDQLARERRAMECIWKEREKQIERVIVNTVGMYGELRGILGGSTAEIPALTLEAATGLLEERGV
jgi:hypothetical protein